MLSAELKTPCDGSCYFGLCPVGLNNCELIMLNVGRAHYYTCEEHGVYWYVGSNLFDGWKSQAEEDWQRNCKLLYTMKEVESAVCDTCWPNSPQTQDNLAPAEFLF